MRCGRIETSIFSAHRFNFFHDGGLNVRSNGICLPAIFTMIYLSAQLYSVFEPYLAVQTAEGRELMAYHASDFKLQRIA